MLLKKDHPLILRQVEDGQAYWDARESLIGLLKIDKKGPEWFNAVSKLDYFQGRRTAAILQNAFQVIQEEYDRGRIKNGKAVLTIGLSHIPRIIKYVDEHKISVAAPIAASAGARCVDYSAPLDLVKGNFGLTVILPKSLADNAVLLEMNRLGKYMSNYRNQAPASLSASDCP